MNNQDNKFYFSTKYGVFIHKTLAVVQDESNPIYQQQLVYQINDGTFEDIDDKYIHISVKVPSLIEEETKKYEKRIADGKALVSLMSAKLRIQKSNGLINEQEHLDTEAILLPIRTELLAGQFISAKRLLEPLEQQLSTLLYSEAHSILSEYIEHNYD